MKKLRMLVLAASVAGLGLMMTATGCCGSSGSCGSTCDTCPTTHCDPCGTGNDWNYTHGGTR